MIFLKKSLILIHIVIGIIYSTLFLLLPRPIIVFPSLAEALPYILIMGLGLTLLVNVYFYLQIKGRLKVAQGELEELEKGELIKGEIGYLSDAGRIRKLDEDSLVIAKVFSTYEVKPAERILIAVADGMGGHSKGEVASYIGAKTVAEETLPYLLERDDKKDFADILSTNMKVANQQILQHALDHPECEGMGTTMTVAILDGNQAHFGHIGDTRAYLIREDGISQLTKDHSYVQQLVDKGEITPEEAKRHPKRNVITRVVGYYSEVEADTYSQVLQENDRILVCCDGLTSYVEDEELKEIVSEALTPKRACEELVKLANERGGSDNISVVLTPKQVDLKKVGKS